MADQESFKSSSEERNQQTENVTITPEPSVAHFSTVDPTVVVEGKSTPTGSLETEHIKNATLDDEQAMGKNIAVDVGGELVGTSSLQTEHIKGMASSEEDDIEDNDEQTEAQSTPDNPIHHNLKGKATSTSRVEGDLTVTQDSDSVEAQENIQIEGKADITLDSDTLEAQGNVQIPIETGELQLEGQPAEIKNAPAPSEKQEQVADLAQEEIGTAPNLPIKIGNVYGAASDRNYERDQLNFSHYVNAFVSLIKAEKTQLPLTIGIFGAWGTGKSFLLNKIVKGLKENAKQPKIHIIEFNAWEYSAYKAVWPALSVKLWIRWTMNFHGVG